jgi:hypothetical protein
MSATRSLLLLAALVPSAAFAQEDPTASSAPEASPEAAPAAPAEAPPAAPAEAPPADDAAAPADASDAPAQTASADEASADDAAPAEATPATAPPARAEKGTRRVRRPEERQGGSPSLKDADREAIGPGGATDAPPQPATPMVPVLQLQTWFTVFDQDETPQADPGGYGDPEDDTGFAIRRARFGFRGAFRGVDYSIRVGAGKPYDAISNPGPVVDLVDAWARIKVSSKGGATYFQVGQHQIPFGREMLTSSNDLVFQDNAVSSRYLSPNRDLGFSIRHLYKFFGIAAGVYNGSGNLFGDTDPGLLVAARADFGWGGDVFRTNSEADTIGFGFAYLYNRTFATTEHRGNFDLLGRYKGLTLLVDGGLAVTTPDEAPVIVAPGVPEKTWRWGVLAQLSYFRDVGIGAIEPAVRFSTYDDNYALQDNGDVAILDAGVSWREPVPFFDVGVGYIHRMELQGRPIDNDTVRIWTGLRYPSRRFEPFDLVEAFRSLGGRPLAPAEEVLPKKMGEGREKKPRTKGS